MITDDKIDSLVNIIKDYRKSEISFPINKDHIIKWLNQFSSESQETILFETTHILSSWYFTLSQIEEILESINSYLVDHFKFLDTYEMLEKVSFLGVQELGLSQRKILQHFGELIDNRYNIKINTTISEHIQHYVFLDDGLYTGSKAKKDIENCLYLLPPNSYLDVFYIVAGQNGLQYLDKILNPIAEATQIKLSFHRWRLLYNDKKQHYQDDGSIIYNKSQTCLWPSSEISSNAKIHDYFENIKANSKNYEKYPFRSAPWNADAGIFTSAENRKIVEKEFLIHGIDIVSQSENSNGMYPLGYNLWPSFGFGSFCAFDMNISNTCPLVLWWGNNIPQGNILDFWYPLLPRRSNNESSIVEHKENIFDFYEYYKMIDQYNMCPDCGCSFGHDNDGGNGFCIDCAMNH